MRRSVIDRVDAFDDAVEHGLRFGLAPSQRVGQIHQVARASRPSSAPVRRLPAAPPPASPRRNRRARCARPARAAPPPAAPASARRARPAGRRSAATMIAVVPSIQSKLRVAATNSAPLRRASSSPTTSPVCAASTMVAAYWLPLRELAGGRAARIGQRPCMQRRHVVVRRRVVGGEIHRAQLRADLQPELVQQLRVGEFERDRPHPGARHGGSGSPDERRRRPSVR